MHSLPSAAVSSAEPSSEAAFPSDDGILPQPGASTECENKCRVADIPQGFSPPPIDYAELANELCVGGVYLRLFAAQPEWQLRHPQRVLSAILAAFSQLLQRRADDDAFAPLCTALLILLRSTPTLAGHVAALGFVGTVFAPVSSGSSANPKLRQFCVKLPCLHIVPRVTFSNSEHIVRNFQQQARTRDAHTHTPPSEATRVATVASAFSTSM
eukprot:6177095-Pleurochrysis_carterae.AAC.1